jgi:hypothetical protein
MSGRHYTILAIVLLAISGCADEKAAADKAAADAKAAAAAQAAAATASKKAPAKGAKAQGEEDPAPVLSVPEGFRYNPKGRRDPFVNPVPPPPKTTVRDTIVVVRPDGLPGVLVAEAKIGAIVSSKEPGMTRVIINAPGRKTYFASKGDILFDGIIKEIRTDSVVFTIVDPTTKRPVDRESTVKTGTSAGTTAGEKK